MLAEEGGPPAASGARSEQLAEAPVRERDAALDGRCPASPAAAAATTEQQVAELYRQFECRFLDKQYAAGLPYLERACAIKSSPRCLLNLAAVHHGLMHCELARSYYVRYLDVVPYDEASDSVQHALDELATSCGTLPAASIEPAPPSVESAAPSAVKVIAPLSAEPTPASPPLDAARGERVAGAPAPATLPPLADESRSTERQVSLWLLGAGAASGAGAVIALVYGARVERDAERRDRANGDLGTGSDPELDAMDRAGRRSNRLAVILGVGSGVLVGTGVTLWLMNPGSGASINVGADGATSVGYSGAF